MKKKSILGLNTVKLFIVVMLSLAIIAIVTLVILGALSSSTVLPTPTGTYTEVNKFINSSGFTLAKASVGGFANPSISSVVNATDGVVVAAGNYTLNTTSGLLTNATATTWANVNVTYTYQYTSSQQYGVSGITGNVSNGITGFFANATTYFSLLGVVVIILIISLVVVVVNRFGGSASEGSL